MNTLDDYGWNQFFADKFNSNNYQSLNYQPARITKESKNQFWIMTADGEAMAKTADKFFKSCFAREELPVVGDWVAVSKPENSEQFFIEAVLERKTRLVRKGKDTYGRNFWKAGESGIRVISSNIDTVFYVASLDHRDFNLTKIERYLMMLYDSGANPVLILNKKDLCPEYAEFVEELQTVSGDLPIHTVSAVDFDGIEELFKYLQVGQTVAFIGSSGVGKSSIVNALMGEETMFVSDIRNADKRGKHTTTHREMLLFPDGGILIDNPGIRDLKPVTTESALETTFEDIVELESQCRFSNCRHNSEPGCAILAAIESGEITEKRVENYQRLKREAEFLDRRAQLRGEFLSIAAKEEKRGEKKIKQHMTGRKNRDKNYLDYS